MSPATPSSSSIDTAEGISAVPNTNKAMLGVSTETDPGTRRHVSSSSITGDPITSPLRVTSDLDFCTAFTILFFRSPLVQHAGGRSGATKAGEKQSRAAPGTGSASG